MEGPRFTINLSCANAKGKLEWYNGPNNTVAWCEVTHNADHTMNVLCHDVEIKGLPEACLMIDANPGGAH
jgi:hypothetical protein